MVGSKWDLDKPSREAKQHSHIRTYVAWITFTYYPNVQVCIDEPVERGELASTDTRPR